jgi:hypothetical protein
MSLTRRLHSLLADPRRESASILTVMLLVLAVISAHVVCGVHVSERAEGGHSHVAAMQSAAPATLGASVAEAAPAPLGGDPHGCSEHHSVTAQCDPVRLPPPGPAVVPELAVQWLVADLAHREPPVRSSVTVAAAPSLTALGISRT